MKKINKFISLSSLSILALTFALPACDEPIADEDSVAQDDEDEALRTGQIVLEDGTELTYIVKNGNALLEGDILLGDADELETSFRSAGSKVFPSATAWPGGVVHYQVQPGFQSVHLAAAIKEFESKTKIRFIPAPDAQGKFVLIGNIGEGCYANYGRPTGNQTSTRLNIGPGCDNFTTWVHEFGHVIGLYHEHIRTDRDTYVNILWQNIKTEFVVSGFQKYKKAQLLGADLGPYDYDSVMHYDSRGGTKGDNPNIYTMTRKDNGKPILKKDSDGLSVGDVQGITFLYTGV